MLFTRRDRAGFLETLRISLWPRRSWARSLRYVLLRIWRLRGTPRSIALGCAAGVFISFTPFLGFHFILAGIIAWVIGGNLLASALGTFFGNPLTFPFIWVCTFNVGHWLLGTETSLKFSELEERLASFAKGLVSFSWDKMVQAIELFWPIMKPMAVGAVPLGFVTAVVMFFVIHNTVGAYRTKKLVQMSGGSTMSEDARAA